MPSQPWVCFPGVDISWLLMCMFCVDQAETVSRRVESSQISCSQSGYLETTMKDVSNWCALLTHDRDYRHSLVHHSSSTPFPKCRTNGLILSSLALTQMRNSSLPTSTRIRRLRNGLGLLKNKLSRRYLGMCRLSSRSMDFGNMYLRRACRYLTWKTRGKVFWIQKLTGQGESMQRFGSSSPIDHYLCNDWLADAIESRRGWGSNSQT